MTPLKFRALAAQDLRDIEKYYQDISQKTTDAVLSDIYQTLTIVRQHPEIGYGYKTGRRRLVSAKYRFVITYAYKGEFVDIVGIYRQQNR